MSQPDFICKKTLSLQNCKLVIYYDKSGFISLGQNRSSNLLKFSYRLGVRTL